MGGLFFSTWAVWIIHLCGWSAGKCLLDNKCVCSAGMYYRVHSRLSAISSSALRIIHPSFQVIRIIRNLAKITILVLSTADADDNDDDEDGELVGEASIHC